MYEAASEPRDESEKPPVTESEARPGLVLGKDSKKEKKEKKKEKKDKEKKDKKAKKEKKCQPEPSTEVQSREAKKQATPEAGQRAEQNQEEARPACDRPFAGCPRSSPT